MSAKRSCLVCSLVAVCALSSGAHAAVTGAIAQLSTGSVTASQTTPSISGNYVVWSGSSLTSGVLGYDIFLQNLASAGAARNLTNSLTDLELIEDIDGNNVVWIHNASGHPGDLVVYDIGAGTSSTVAASSSSLRFDQPAIRGRYLVYVRAATQFDLEGYDLALGIPLPRLTNDAAAQLHPRLTTDYVVYEDYGSGNADIYGYKLATAGPPFAIATGAATQASPDIDGNTVVWVESTSSGDSIVSYNLTTRAIATVPSVPSHKLQPRLSGTRVVWSDDRSGNLDLYSYDFSTGVEDLLVGGAGDQMIGDVDGNRVVYSSNATGFEQVFLYTITSSPAPSLLPEGCDPARTDAADGAVDLVKDAVRALFPPPHSYTVVDGKNYWLCVENGSLGGNRISNLTLTNDGKTILTPSDFAPTNNPPHWVAGRLFANDGGAHGGPGVKHSWSASLLGGTAATVTITLRVGK